MTQFQAVLRVLKQRIIRSGDGWADNEAWYERLHAGDLLTVALCQAVHEMLWTVRIACAAVESGMHDPDATHADFQVAENKPRMLGAVLRLRATPRLGSTACTRSNRTASGAAKSTSARLKGLTRVGAANGEICQRRGS